MKSSAIAIGVAGDVTAYFTVTGNRISANNELSSFGIALVTDKNVQADLTTLSNLTVRATITGNTIADTSGGGIRVLQRDSNGTANVRIENNTNTNVTGGLSGIRIDGGSSGNAAFNPTLCASIDNYVAGSGTDGFGDKHSGIELLKRSTSATTYRFGLVGLSPSPANVAQTEAFVSGQNPGSDTGTGFFAGKKVIVLVGDNFTSCTLPAGM